MSDSTVMSDINSEVNCDALSCGKDKQEKKRETWGHQAEFILALVGYSVGLGNVWRFPYLCYRNGGGAFLIPYFICVVFAGIPLFFLEIALGQSTQLSAIKVWRIAPCMKGVGIGCAIVNALCAIYYIVVLAWSLLYLVHSVLPGDLPWTTCDNWWNTENCTNILGSGNWSGLFEKNISARVVNFTTTPVNQVANMTTAAANYTTRVITSPSHPAMEFWQHYVLRQSSGIDTLGAFNNWPLFFSFIASWIGIYFCVFKGVRSSGKIVYVSATLPYLMLFVLMIRGLSLEGAVDGITYMLNPDFSKLLQPKVWVEAGGQIFFSYGICFTVLFAFGSYNPRHNDCHKQSIVLAIACSLTSVLASLVIFSILGHMSYTKGVKIDEVATEGPGLAFFVYPVGLSLLPAPKIWSVLFFATLIMVGVDTQFAGAEAAISVMIDCFPRLNTMKRGRELTSALVLLVFLLLGLPLLTQGGIYVFELFNMYGVSGITLLWLTVFESIGIGWVYGADRFFDDVRSMIGYYPLTYFKICYKYLTPAISTFIFVFYCAKYKPLVVDGYVFPGWANAVGWLMSVASMLCVPVFFFHYLAVNGWKIRGADDRKQKFGQNGKKQKGAETRPLTSKEDIVVSVGLDTITKA